MEEFVNELLLALSENFNDNQLFEIKNMCNIVLNNYNVEKKSTEIILFSDIITECYKVYMVTKKIEGLSDKTLEQYRITLELFFRNVNKDISDITQNDIRAYLYRYQKERKIKNGTLDDIRGNINCFFEWCYNEGYINKNPCKNIKPIKREKKDIEVLNDFELEMIRNSCKDKREKAIVETLYSTGLRVSELLKLNWADVLDKDSIDISGKGNKHRIIYFNAKSKIAIKEYIDERQDNDVALFVSERKPIHRMGKEGIEKIVRNIGNRACIGRRVYPHLFRHTVATHGLRRGMPVQEVQRLLGHSNINTTINNYAKVSNDDVRKGHEKYII